LLYREIIEEVNVDTDNEKDYHFYLFLLAFVVSTVTLGFCSLLRDNNTPLAWTKEASTIIQEEAPTDVLSLVFAAKSGSQTCTVSREDGSYATLSIPFNPAIGPIAFGAHRVNPYTWAARSSSPSSLESESGVEGPQALSVDEFHQLVHDCVDGSGQIFQNQTRAARLENEASWAHAIEDRANGKSASLPRASDPHQEAVTGQVVNGPHDAARQIKAAGEARLDSWREPGPESNRHGVVQPSGVQRTDGDLEHR
jgi:hypothetical protein